MPESMTGGAQSSGLRSESTGASPAGGDLQRNAEHTARSIAEDLKKAGAEKANTGLKERADTTQQFAESVSAAARNFESQPVLGRLANEAADAVERVSKELRTADVDQLLRQVRTVARTNPALFTLGAVALGFGLARFFKAGDTEATSSSTAASGHLAGGSPSSAAWPTNGSGGMSGTSSGGRDPPARPEARSASRRAVPRARLRRPDRRARLRRHRRRHGPIAAHVVAAVPWRRVTCRRIHSWLEYIPDNDALPGANSTHRLPDRRPRSSDAALGPGAAA